MWEAELSGHSPSPSLFIVKIAPQHCYIALVLYSAQWFQIAKTRQNYVHLISQFFNLFAADLSTYNISVSGDCMRFVLKKCQNVACTSMIRQFHEFFRFYFWRVFFNLVQLCSIPNVLSKAKTASSIANSSPHSKRKMLVACYYTSTV